MAALPCAAQPDPAALLRKMVDAEKRNREQSAYFVYREDIRSSAATAGQLPRQTGWITYEVTLLEGESYHRPVARDGVPFGPAEQDAQDQRFQKVGEYRRNTPIEERRRRYFEAEEHRYRFDSEIVARYHDATVLGVDKVGDRDVWLVSTEPRRGAPRPKRRSEWSLCQRIKYWIDQSTWLPLRFEAEQLYDYEGTRKGAISRVETVLIDGVMLPERITNTTSSGGGRQRSTLVTDQTYSAYKRFQTETVLLFTDPSLSVRY